jgi:hypothetical protein
MEWVWHDPERDEATKWWTIDPQTGKSDGVADSDRSKCHCLGDSVLDEVGLSGDAIATTFATKHFSDDEVSALILNRVVPSSFKGGVQDAAELLDLVDGLWTLAQSYYQRALGRLPTQFERRWLYASAFDALRARENLD